MCAHFCCTHISRILFAFDAHSRTSHAHLKEDNGLEAEELPEEVVEVLNKFNLKVEHFDINTDDDDDTTETTRSYMYQ